MLDRFKAEKEKGEEKEREEGGQKKTQRTSREEILEEVLRRTSRLLEEKPRVLLAIDGPSGAGKTTLAEVLCREVSKTWSCQILHMDDFFVPAKDRPGRHMAGILGNVDYERLLREVLVPLARGEGCLYRPFDCGRQCYGRGTWRKPTQVLVAEGAYSCHPALFPYYDLRIFLALSPQEQAARICRRSPEKARDFFERWIPAEEAYFAAYRIPESCDLILGT